MAENKPTILNDLAALGKPAWNWMTDEKNLDERNWTTVVNPLFWFMGCCVMACIVLMCICQMFGALDS